MQTSIDRSHIAKGTTPNPLQAIAALMLEATPSVAFELSGPGMHSSLRSRSASSGSASSGSRLGNTFPVLMNEQNVAEVSSTSIASGKEAGKLAVGDTIKCRIMKLDLYKREISVSCKPGKRLPNRRKKNAELKAGEEVEGVVLSVRDFGLFLDIGTETRALLPRVLLNGSPKEFSGGDVIKCHLQNINPKTGDWILTCKGPTEPTKPMSELVVGEEVAGTVSGITNYGAFVDIGSERYGLLLWRYAAEKVVEGEKIKCRIAKVESDAIKLVCRDGGQRTSDLKVGAEVEGTVIVSNSDGAWVDIGYEQLAELPKELMQDEAQELTEGDKVQCSIYSLIHEIGNIMISCKDVEGRPLDELTLDEEVEGTIKRVTPSGLMVDIGAQRPMTIPESQLSEGDTLDSFQAGQTITCRVLHVNLDQQNICGTFRNRRDIPLSPSWFNVGDLMLGRVFKVNDGGSMVNIGSIHDAKLRNDLMSGAPEEVTEGATIKCRLLLYDAQHHDLRVSCIGMKSRPVHDFTVGEEVEGVVQSIIPEGALVDVGAVTYALLPVHHMENEVQGGDTIQARVERVKLDGLHQALQLSTKTDRGKLLEDIEVGDVFEGTVQKVGNFGAILEIGAEDQPLMPKRHTYGVDQELVAGDKIKCRIILRDLEKRRLQVTHDGQNSRPLTDLEVGEVVEGEVVKITPAGAFVNIGAAVTGMLYKDEMTEEFLLGDQVRCRILKVEPHKWQIGLSCKEPPPAEKSVDDFKVGDVVEGTIQKVESRGVRLEVLGARAFMPFALMSDEVDPHNGNRIKCRIYDIGKDIDPKALKECLYVAHLEERGGLPLNELEVGEIFEGKVKRVTAAGQYVDIGAEQLGLLSNDQQEEAVVSDPFKKLRAGDDVLCSIASVNLDRYDLQLTTVDGKVPLKTFQVGDQFVGRVKGLTQDGAMVDIGAEADALLPISEM